MEAAAASASVGGGRGSDEKKTQPRPTAAAAASASVGGGRGSDEKKTQPRPTAAAACDVEALRRCLEENKGDRVKCQAHIDAFRSSCSAGPSTGSKLPSSSS